MADAGDGPPTRPARPAHWARPNNGCALPAWRETPFFSRREGAALASAEATTLLADGHVPSADYDAAAAEFRAAELAALISALVTTNAWNRIGAAARCRISGSYAALTSSNIELGRLRVDVGLRAHPRASSVLTEGEPVQVDEVLPRAGRELQVDGMGSRGGAHIGGN